MYSEGYAGCFPEKTLWHHARLLYERNFSIARPLRIGAETFFVASEIQVEKRLLVFAHIRLISFTLARSQISISTPGCVSFNSSIDFLNAGVIIPFTSM